MPFVHAASPTASPEYSGVPMHEPSGHLHSAPAPEAEAGYNLVATYTSCMLLGTAPHAWICLLCMRVQGTGGATLGEAQC